MDIGKFLHLITSKKLWFTRASELTKADPYEGALTEADRKLFLDISQAKSKPELRKLLIDRGWKSGFFEIMDDNSDFSLEYFQMIFMSTSSTLPIMSAVTAVSCWHSSPTESDAMWQLYSHKQAGVAIKTTPQRMIDAIECPDHIIDIARIKYDSQRDASALASIVHSSLLIKRDAFRHEQEVRLLTIIPHYSDADPGVKEISGIKRSTHENITGISFPVKLDNLIEEIVISPKMPDYYEESIRNLIKTQIPSCPVRRSRLYEFEEMQIPMSQRLSELMTFYGKTGRLLDFHQIKELHEHSVRGK